MKPGLSYTEGYILAFNFFADTDTGTRLNRLEGGGRHPSHALTHIPTLSPARLSLNFYNYLSFVSCAFFDYIHNELY